MRRSQLASAAALFALLTAGLVSGCAATNASLDPTNGDPCASQRGSYVLTTFTAVQGIPEAEGSSVPLRCGKNDPKGWGYRHFSGRFAGVASEFTDDIQTTFDSGKRTRFNKDTVLYQKAWSNCGCPHKAMTVVVGLSVQQPDQGIRGIVTAYWWDNPDRADPSMMTSEYDPGT